MLKRSITFALFVVGVCCFLLIFLLPDETRILVLSGSVFWECAFFRVLADNYKRRAPVPTRGGVLTYGEKPRAYNFAFGLMAFIGAFFLVVIISLTAFRR